MISEHIPDYQHARNRVNATETAEFRSNISMGIWIAIGVAIGVAIGAMYGSIGAGIGIGIAMGIAFAMTRKQRNS